MYPIIADNGVVAAGAAGLSECRFQCRPKMTGKLGGQGGCSGFLDQAMRIVQHTLRLPEEVDEVRVQGNPVDSLPDPAGEGLGTETGRHTDELVSPPRLLDDAIDLGDHFRRIGVAEHAHGAGQVVGTDRNTLQPLHGKDAVDVAHRFDVLDLHEHHGLVFGRLSGCAGR